MSCDDDDGNSEGEEEKEEGEEKKEKMGSTIQAKRMKHVSFLNKDRPYRAAKPSLEECCHDSILCH